MTTEVIEPELRTGLKRAIAWRTLTEIARRHPTLRLRLVETHPCDGQYDCLTLVRLPEYQMVCTFNLAGTSLLLGPPLGHRRPLEGLGSAYQDDLWRYPEHGLGEDRGALAKHVEARLGFPEPASLPQRTTAGLSLGVIAELLDRSALGLRPVDARNGWLDSSGYSGGGIRSWAMRLPALVDVSGEPAWQPRRRAAIRYWALDRGADASVPRVVIDIATSAVWVGGKARTSLVSRYQTGLGVRGLAWWLEQALGGEKA